MTTAYELLDDLEFGMACEDDRDVSEFRDRHPGRVRAIDALRAVLELCDREDDEGGIGIVPSFLVRTAIKDALETE